MLMSNRVSFYFTICSNYAPVETVHKESSEIAVMVYLTLISLTELMVFCLPDKMPTQ